MAILAHIRPLLKLHLPAKIALFGIFAAKFLKHVHTHVFEIFPQICTKIAYFIKQSEFRKRSINHQLADLKKYFNKGEKVTIAHCLDESLVLFLDEQERDSALKKLVDLLDATGKLHDARAFYHAILEREKLVSTGVGMGVAIPHAKLEGYSSFFIAIGIQSKQGIEWNALDGSPVRLIFMIGGPENKQTEYLKILSRLTMAIKDEERRKKLLRAVKPKDVIALFKGC